MVRVSRNPKVQVVPSENTPIVLSEFNGATEGEETTDIGGLSPDQRSDKLERMYRPLPLTPRSSWHVMHQSQRLIPTGFASFPEPKAEEALPTFGIGCHYRRCRRRGEFG